MVGSPPADAGGAGSGPGPGGSRVLRSGWARAPRLLSLCSGARVPRLLRPACLELVLHSGRGHRDERPARRSGEWPLLAATREGPHAAIKTQYSQK